MKNDLATAILVTIVGVAISYLVCNMFFGDIPPFAFKTLQEVTPTELAEPNSNVFNSRSINPTVEVYVGDCEDNDDYEACINGGSDQGQINQDVINEGGSSKDSDKSNSNNSSNKKDQ